MYDERPSVEYGILEIEMPKRIDKMENLSFGMALDNIVSGKFKVMRRKDWEWKFILVQSPKYRANTMTYPFLFTFCRGVRMPWTPTQEDMFSRDWVTER